MGRPFQPTSRQSFADYLGEARSTLDMQQKDLAKAVEVDPSLVNKWERGVQLPQTRYLPAIARVLQVDLTDLTLRHAAASMDETKRTRREVNTLREENRLLMEKVERLIAVVERLLENEPFLGP